MDDKNMTVWEGSQVPLTVEQGDSASVSASFVMINQDTEETFTVTGEYEDVDGVMIADVSLTDQETVVGVYDYYIAENFEDEDPLIYPDPNDCDDDCELPTITVCEIPGGESS